MTNKLLNELTIEIERVTKDFKLLEAELRLLRDWRDTWLEERTRVFKENDSLRKALSKVSSIILKVDLGQYKSINSKD